MTHALPMQHSSPPQSGTYGRRPTPLEYRRFRVRTPVRSFRDLEVHKSTTDLAAALFTLKLPKENTLLVPELALLKKYQAQKLKVLNLKRAWERVKL